MVNCFPPRMLLASMKTMSPPGGRPDQAHRNAGPLDALFHFPLCVHFGHAECFADHFRRHDQLVRLALGDAPRLFADQCGDFALQVAHAGFTRVAVDDFAQAFVGEFDLLVRLSGRVPSIGAESESCLAIWIFSSSV